MLALSTSLGCWKVWCNLRVLTQISSSSHDPQAAAAVIAEYAAEIASSKKHKKSKHKKDKKDNKEKKEKKERKEKVCTCARAPCACGGFG